MSYRPNGATLDTNQTVTGIKTFGVGDLLMRNAANTASNEPYSDSNPPESLMMTERVDVPPIPTGGITLFTRSDKARRLLAQIGPNGVDTALQPALFSNRVGLLTASMGVAAVQTLGLVTSQAVAPALQAFATTNFYTRLARTRYATAATANTGGGGPRTTTAQWFLSNTPNLGGFFFVARFGIGAALAGSRGFIGMTTQTTAIPTADPSTSLNQIGFGWNAAHNNLWLMQNGTTSVPANHVDLGANFPTKVSTTDFYEVRLFAPSGVSNSVSWAVTRLNTGASASGTITTGLPAVDTIMAAHCAVGTSVATATSLDVQSLYVESDN